MLIGVSVLDLAIPVADLLLFGSDLLSRFVCLPLVGVAVSGLFCLEFGFF